MKQWIKRIISALLLLVFVILGYNMYLLYQRNQSGGFTKEDLKKIDQQIKEIEEKSKLIPDLEYSEGKG